MSHSFNGSYNGENIDRIVFPMGGIGAGMIGFEGLGGFCDIAIEHKPTLFTKPIMFAALHVDGVENGSRVLEGPVPDWRIFGPSPEKAAGQGDGHANFGLPRFEKASFQARFPFGTVSLQDHSIPIKAEITGWSPFIPNDADDSSLPAAGVEYTFTNTGPSAVKLVFSFHAAKIIWTDGVSTEISPVPGGFKMHRAGTEEKPYLDAAMIAAVDDPDAAVDCRWFRGGFYDPMTLVWKAISEGRVVSSEPPDTDHGIGASLYVPFDLKPGETRTICLRLSWYVPLSNLRVNLDDRDGNAADCCCKCETAELPKHRPWYSSRFESVQAVEDYWKANYNSLRSRSEAFSKALYDTTFPPEVVEAVTANLAIFKTPTMRRQHDGRFWMYEGCAETDGCCFGSCTHVWNYAQAACHLFPELERGLRDTECEFGYDDTGHYMFRLPLPITRHKNHSFPAAADGQLGGIMKVYREWRTSGDVKWLRKVWPCVRLSLNYCINTWDPDHTGALLEPHHNTYDMEFWGADGMCTSFYLGALVAALRMAEALGDDPEPFRMLAERSKAYLETKLFNGEYFTQVVQWKGLHAPDPTEAQDITNVGKYFPEAVELLEQEGPKYQYGNGCLSDGVLGAWMAEMCGIGSVLDAGKTEAHLLAVHKYNLRHDLSNHANPQRPGYALGNEGGLLLCSWPHGDALTLPFPYSNEVWTGIEYQAASHLILMGRVEEGLEIVRVARKRYNGSVRDPFDEYECGHWYGRALSSYGLLQALSGARYDAVDKVLYLNPRVPGDFRAFLCTASGYGTVGVKDGRPFLEVREGSIPFERIEYTPCA